MGLRRLEMRLRELDLGLREVAGMAADRCGKLRGVYLKHRDTETQRPEMANGRSELRIDN